MQKLRLRGVKMLDGYVAFQITGQPSNMPASWKASNGIELVVNECPAWHGWNRLLFLWGGCAPDDSIVISCTAEEWPLICEAVREFNSAHHREDVLDDEVTVEYVE